MAETKERLDPFAVVPTVSDKNPLFVFHLFAVPGIGIQGDSRIVLQPYRKGERQFARRIHFACEHRSDRIAGFRTSVPCLDNGRHFVHPRHRYCVAADDDCHQVPVHAGQFADQLVL